MKAYKLLFLLWTAVNIFVLGTYFGSRPYREVLFSGTSNANVVFTEIGMQQTHALLLLGYLQAALIVASFAFGMVDHFRGKRMLNRLSHPGPSVGRG